MMKTNPEVIMDYKKIKYNLVFSKKGNQLIGNIMKDNKKLGEVYGKTKPMIMKNAKENLDIIIYD